MMDWVFKKSRYLRNVTEEYADVIAAIEAIAKVTPLLLENTGTHNLVFWIEPEGDLSPDQRQRICFELEALGHPIVSDSEDILRGIIVK